MKDISYYKSEQYKKDIAKFHGEIEATLKNPRVVKKFTEWMRLLELNLKKKYHSKGLKASGQWEKDLEVKIDLTQKNIINGQILGSYYTYWLENGRGKNKDQSIEGIGKFVGWAGSTFLKEWCKNKGIDTRLSYAIAHKIATQGYKSKGIVSDSITEAMKINFANRIKDWYVVEYKSITNKK